MANSEPDRERATDERLRHGGSGGYGADREREVGDEGSAAPDPERNELADEDEEGFPRGAEA